MVLMCAGMSAAAVALMLLFYIFLERQLTFKRLDKHQREWDAAKAEMVKNGFHPKKIDDAYIDYINKLMLDRNVMTGACFPRK